MAHGVKQKHVGHPAQIYWDDKTHVELKIYAAKMGITKSEAIKRFVRNGLHSKRFGRKKRTQKGEQEQEDKRFTKRYVENILTGL